MVTCDNSGFALGSCDELAPRYAVDCKGLLNQGMDPDIDKLQCQRHMSVRWGAQDGCLCRHFVILSRSQKAVDRVVVWNLVLLGQPYTSRCGIATRILVSVLLPYALMESVSYMIAFSSASNVS